MHKKKLIAVIGPTASGKTALAVRLASTLKTEILSADSRQVYKELRIGTAMPTDEERKDVKHHFLGHKSIFDSYTAGIYACEAGEKLDTLFQIYDTLVLVGGSGLYIKALLEGLDEIPVAAAGVREALQKKLLDSGLESLQVQLRQLDPEYAQQVDLQNTQRVMRALEVCISTGNPYSQYRKGVKKQLDYDVIYTMVDWERDQLYARINTRVDFMIANGLWDEAMFWKEYSHLTALQTVGYKEIFHGINHGQSYTEIIDAIKQNTRRYAKRQLTWFRQNNECILIPPRAIENASILLQKLTI